jgi:uncharacterized protein YqhQ
MVNLLSKESEEEFGKPEDLRKQSVEDCARCKDLKIDFAVGGQAVIEGVMMRSPNSITIAVRKSDGSITLKKEKYKTLTQKIKQLNIPIVRGVVNLLEMMFIGTKAINFSAAQSLDEPEQEVKDKNKLTLIFEGLMFALSFVVAIGFSLALFKVVPLSITTFLESKSITIQNNFFLFNLVDGLLKMTIFLTYIFLLSLIPSFRRIFEYHGAEHKSIFNYESKEPLNVDNADKQIRFHPRCGTSFIIIVFFISILVYSLIPRPETFLMNLGMRITVLPLIAGISYEALKISAKYSDKLFVKALVTPGLWFQRLTTKEPNKKQLEVGLASLKAALVMEESRVA